MSDDEAEKSHSVTAALLRLAREHNEPRLSLGTLLNALDGQGFGLVILLLALPNMVPGPLIPGFSVPFAIGISALGVQLMLGMERTLLPQRVLRWSLRTDRFGRFMGKVEPRLLRLERMLRPRPSWLNRGLGLRLAGVMLVFFSLVLALPVPFGNLPVALAIGLAALGLLEDDGMALAWGLGAGVLAVLWNGAVIFAGAEILQMVGLRLR